MSKTIKRVAAAAMVRDGRVLIMRRAPFLSYAGWWEFPGGKLEPGESERDCVARELHEELNIRAEAGELCAKNVHEYPTNIVELSVFLVSRWEGEISLVVHDAMEWVPFEELADFPGLLPADIPVALKLKTLRNNCRLN